MLVLLDRAFDANAFLADSAATGAMLLARSKSTRNPQVLEHLPDGSYLSCLDDRTFPAVLLAGSCHASQAVAALRTPAPGGALVKGLRDRRD